MKFIKLTLPDGDGSEFFVNMSLAYTMYRNEKIEKSITNISFGNDYDLMVVETPTEIINILSDLS